MRSNFCVFLRRTYVWPILITRALKTKPPLTQIMTSIFTRKTFSSKCFDEGRNLDDSQREVSNFLRASFEVFSEEFVKNCQNSLWEKSQYFSEKTVKILSERSVKILSERGVRILLENLRSFHWGICQNCQNSLWEKCQNPLWEKCQNSHWEKF